MESFHVVYQNDNGWAYNSDDIQAPDKAAAKRIARKLCPMGPYGLLRVYSENEWKAEQDKLKLEDERFKAKRKREDERLIWPKDEFDFVINN